MSTNVTGYVVCKEFEKALRGVIVQETKPELLLPAKYLSETLPYPYSRKLFDSNKSIFNFVDCDNEFELTFVKFLHIADDVLSFSKLPQQFGFSIPYTDTHTNIRHYFPDFIAKTSDKDFWIIETKGREDIEVAMKDPAAHNWCENTTSLTEFTWRYLKVNQSEFEKHHPDSFHELVLTFKKPDQFN